MDEHQKSFDGLKILSTEPLLIYPDFWQPFIVACDASTKAIGAVSHCAMVKTGLLHTVVGSWTLLNLSSVTELELLAFIF